VALVFEVLDLDVGATFFEIDGFFGRFASASGAISGDEFFAINGDGSSVIGIEEEGVFAIAGDIEPAFPDEA